MIESEAAVREDSLPFTKTFFNPIKHIAYGVNYQCDARRIT